MPAELLSKYNGKLYQPHHVAAELPPELHVESTVKYICENLLTSSVKFGIVNNSDIQGMKSDTTDSSEMAN